MGEPATSLNVVRFGSFELDLLSRELRKSGVRIRLQEQPFQVLAMLVERPGTIVTREEIQQKLWPSDTFVEFDLSLNTAVKKLRQALGDESDNPRFVETLYRRGYRFVAPVTIQTSDGARQSSGGNGNSAVLLPGPKEPEATQREMQSPPAESARKRINRRKLLILPAVLLFAVALAFWLPPSSSPRVIGYTQITRNELVQAPVGFLATDGQRLYFCANENGRFVVAQVSVSGGDSTVAAATFPDTFLEDVAPDGSAMLIGSLEGTSGKSGPAWRLPLPAGAPQQLPIMGNSVVWTPDGQNLVFTRDSDILESKADGSKIRKLATLNARVTDVRVSPDEKRIRVTVNDLKTGFSSLWELNRDGSNAHPLLPNWTPEPHECCGHWTPDGRYFLFVSVRDGRSNIWVLPERRYSFQPKPRPVELTNGPLAFSTLVPSQDGRRIFAAGAQPRTEVLRYDGGSFSPYFEDESATDLAFSSDGQRVAYVSIPDEALWVQRLDGSHRVQLTNSVSMEVALPRWSPDGSQIVFMARTSNTDWHAYLVSSTGGALRELIPGSAAGFDPGWSPDGKSILLSINDLGATSSSIQIFNLETQKLTPLPGGETLFSPRWSPDGRYIAALSTDSQTLMLFDRQTQHWTELAHMGIGYPSWSRNSKYLYFDSILNEDPAVYRVRIADHALERIVSLKGMRRFWGANGQWSGLAPDDSFLITRDTSNSELYALDWQP